VPRDAVTEVLTGLHATERERVAALRAERRFFWIDVSLSETSCEDMVDALGIPERSRSQRFETSARPRSLTSTGSTSRWTAF
jgi:hypothetical protein